jgi:hypothetical protein
MGVMMDTAPLAAFALIYGESGLGKSTDMAATFPGALFVCRPGGMTPAASFLGITVREIHVRTLEEVIGLIPLAKEHGHDSVVVDDLSLLAESTDRDFEVSGKAARNKFAKYVHLNTLCASLREQGRFVGIHFAANAHERPRGKDAQGRERSGGPKMASWNMAESVVHEASIVLRCTQDASRRDKWKSVYDVGGDGWVGKDRMTAAAARSPQNLRAILTAGGYTLARTPGLEWQDEVVGSVKSKLDSGEDHASLVEALWPKLTGAGLDPRHVAWALRDGFAAHELRQSTANRFRELFDFSTPGASAFGS